MDDPIDLNELPELVNSGTFTVKQAVDYIAEYIHKNPVKFGLGKFDEDFRSEFLLSFLQNAGKLFFRYDKRYGQFLPYLYAFSKGVLLTLIRDSSKKDSNVFSTRREEENTWEYKTKQYMPDLYVADNFYENKKYVFHEVRQPVENYCSIKKNSAEKKIAMVLALKSSFFLSDDHVSFVSDYCGVEKRNLENTLYNLNKLLEKRAEHCAILRVRRDNAYYFHRKYADLINQETSENHKKKLQKKYERQTENWYSKNAQLQKTGYRLCPTNKTVANVLGICERQVSYYISRAKKNIENTEIYENEVVDKADTE